MQTMMFMDRGSSVFKSDNQRSEPFPPSYYENKKRASELISRMSTPKKESAKNP